MEQIHPTGKTSKRPSIKSGRAKAETGTKASFKQVADQVTLSETSKTQKTKIKASASEIRHDLVQKFRGHLEDGTYVVKAQEIADKMVQKIRENKDRTVI